MLNIRPTYTALKKSRMKVTGKNFEPKDIG